MYPYNTPPPRLYGKVEYAPDPEVAPAWLEVLLDVIIGLVVLAVLAAAAGALMVLSWVSPYLFFGTVAVLIAWAIGWLIRSVQ